MSSEVAPAGKAPLDDVMLAMDVVDTLRHRSKLVEKELSQEGRDEALKERLRKIYAAQGIEVPDHVIEQGVAALKENRFVYESPEKGLQVWLARIYIARARWGKWLLGGTLAIVVAVLAYITLVAAPRSALPGKLEAMHGEVLELAEAPGATSRANELYAGSQSDLRDGDRDGAETALAALAELRDRLEQTYHLDIVSRPGAQSGLWRVSEGSSSRNYYIVVEAKDADDRLVKVAITSEENGETRRVSTWAVRVDERVYQRVGRDKQDDGIIQNQRFGTKSRGYLEPEYSYPVRGGAITSW